VLELVTVLVSAPASAPESGRVPAMVPVPGLVMVPVPGLGLVRHMR